jgi:TRAP-type C4-dicarboxylate transport system substrate-binding protein
MTMKSTGTKEEQGIGLGRREFLKKSGMILGAVSLGGIPFETRAQNVAKWKYYYYTPPLHHDTVTMKEFAKVVEQLTGNQVQITIHPGGELPYAPMEALNIVRDKFVDGAGAVSDFVAGSAPLLNLMNLPMLVTDLNEMTKAMKVFMPYVEKDFEVRGIRTLFSHFNSQKCVFGRGKPVSSLNDLKGMKIRSFGVPDAQFIQRLGAIPVAMPNTEVPQAMQRGVMDAFIASAFFTLGSRWDDLMDWAYLIDMAVVSVYEVVGVPSLKGLSADQSKTLFDLAVKYQERWNQEIVELERKARVDMANKGKKMLQATENDRAKAMEIIKPYWSEWAKSVGPNAVEALQKVRETLNK